MLRDGGEADLVLQDLPGHRHGHDADGVGRAGILAAKRLGGQIIFCRRDEFDRSAADLVGRRDRKQAGIAQEHAGAEGGIHLVARKGHEVEMVALTAAAHGNRPVPGQLGRIDKHQTAVAVREAGDLAQGRQGPRQIRGPRDRNQHAPPALPPDETIFQDIQIQDAVVAGGNADGIQAPPRQVVGAVLEFREQHGVARLRRGGRASAAAY